MSMAGGGVLVTVPRGVVPPVSMVGGAPVAVLRAGAGVPTAAAGASAPSGVPGALPRAMLGGPGRTEWVLPPRGVHPVPQRGPGASSRPSRTLPWPGAHPPARGSAPHAQCSLCSHLGLLKGTLRAPRHGRLRGARPVPSTRPGAPPQPVMGSLGTALGWQLSSALPRAWGPCPMLHGMG